MLWLLACLATNPSLERGGNPPAVGERFGEVLRSDDGRMEAWVEVVVDGSEVRVRRGAEVTTLWSQGAPDRLAMGPDGALAWVASAGGLPAIFVASPNGSVRQLTNVDLPAAKGGPPPGFVPPPVGEGELRFDVDVLRWPGPDGEALSVRWRSR